MLAINLFAGWIVLLVMSALPDALMFMKAAPSCPVPFILYYGAWLGLVLRGRVTERKLLFISIKFQRLI